MSLINNLKHLLSRLNSVNSNNQSEQTMETKECEACRTDATKITKDELDFMMKSLTNWRVFNDEGMDKVERVYEFTNFEKALDFTNKVGQLAEKHNHHPALLTEWGKVTVTWWSHGVGGLTLKDLDMAGGCDNLNT